MHKGSVVSFCGFDESLGKLLVPSHSCLSLYDHWQACSSHTDDNESNPALPAAVLLISGLVAGSESAGLHAVNPLMFAHH